MSIILHVGNEQEVGSASHLMADLAKPGQSMLVCSGIALPEIHFNSDEGTREEDVEVRLGVYVAKLVQAVAHVGLASIQAAESAFTFATDSIEVNLDPATHEVFLTVHTRTRANAAFLHRFGYQVAALVEPVFTKVTGKVYWKPDVLDLTVLSDAQVDLLLKVQAQRYELVAEPLGGAFEQLTPVGTGRITGRSRSARGYFVEYVVEGLPFETSLVISVTPSLAFDKPGAITFVKQVDGPRPFTLTFSAPSRGDEDFEIAREPGGQR